MKNIYFKKIQQFCHTLPIKKAQLHKNEITLIVKNTNLKPLFVILKNHMIWQYKTLVNITCIDHPQKSHNFSVSYELLSLRFNDRIRIKTFTNGLSPLDSIQPVFNSAGWSESEIWDMFGIFFLGHPKLRRLLTDYGFEGYPLNKDYPLSGYEEVFYDYETKTLGRKRVELSQDGKDLMPTSPWKVPFSGKESNLKTSIEKNSSTI